MFHFYTPWKRQLRDVFLELWDVFLQELEVELRHKTTNLLERRECAIDIANKEIDQKTDELKEANLILAKTKKRLQEKVFLTGLLAFSNP